MSQAYWGSETCIRRYDLAVRTEIGLVVHWKEASEQSLGLRMITSALIAPSRASRGDEWVMAVLSDWLDPVGALWI